VWRSTRPVIPHMIAQGEGSIVMISSTAGLRASPGVMSYVASKFGVIGLAKTLAQELAPHCIRVNAVCPTNCATPMFHNQTYIDMFAGKENATIDEMVFPSQAMMVLSTPWIEPEDVSNAVIFLVSDKARFITGLAMPVDAGSLTQAPGVPPIASQWIAERKAAETGH
jgi:(+)-trans-carveol dehydrogenase